MENNPTLPTPAPKQAAGEKAAQELYYWIFVFLVCGFVGWVYETIAVGIFKGFTNRGYLFIVQPLATYLPFLKGVSLFSKVPFVWGLPFIEIYGFGGAIILFAFRRFEKRPVALFFAGFVGMSLFELFSSYFCSFVLKRTFWDYSHQPFNFQGRIAPHSALVWGLLTVVAVKLIAPLLDKLYAGLKDRKAFKPVVWVLVAYCCVCALVKYWLFPGITPY